MKRCINGRCKQQIPDDALFCQYCGWKQIKERTRKRRTRRANGEGSVYKLGGTQKRSRPWYATYKGKSLGRTFATRGEAEKALEQMIATTHPDLYMYTLEDVYNAWSEVAYRDMGVSSLKGYKLSWKYVPDTLRKKLARDVRTDDFQALIDELQQEQGLSDSSVNKIKSLYSQLCKWMQQRDLILQNYSLFLKIQKTEHREPKPFTLDEIASINALAKGPDNDRMTQAARLTMIMIFTGVRIGEMFGLLTSGVHLDEPIPYIQGGIKTAAGRDRVVPVHAQILPYLRFFWERADSELLISGYCGQQKPNGWRANDYAKMLKHLGIEYKVPHNTRKTMSTQSAMSGMSQTALLKIMGWTDVAVANKYYIAPDVAMLAEQMDKLNGWSATIEDLTNKKNSNS